MTDVVKATENIFLALGFPAHEAEILQLRTQLMVKLKHWIDEQQLTQTEAAQRLGISQARVSDLVRGHWKKFSLDMLLTLAGKAGIKARVIFDEAA